MPEISPEIPPTAPEVFEINTWPSDPREFYNNAVNLLVRKQLLRLPIAVDTEGKAFTLINKDLDGHGRPIQQHSELVKKLGQDVEHPTGLTFSVLSFSAENPQLDYQLNLGNHRLYLRSGSDKYTGNPASKEQLQQAFNFIPGATVTEIPLT